MSSRNRDHVFTDGQFGAALKVKVTPRGAQNQITEVRDGTVHVLYTGAAEDRNANTVVIQLLSEKLGVPANQFDIVAGDTSSQKLVSVLGIRATEVEARLTA